MGDTEEPETERAEPRENRLLPPHLRTLVFLVVFLAFSVGVTICRCVLRENKTIHFPYYWSHVSAGRTTAFRRRPGWEKHLSASAGSALPRRHPSPDSGGGFCLSPWHTMKCREHMVRVRWGLMKVKNGTAALIPSQHQWRSGLGPEWDVMFSCCLHRRGRQSPPDSKSRWGSRLENRGKAPEREAAWVAGRSKKQEAGLWWAGQGPFSTSNGVFRSGSSWSDGTRTWNGTLTGGPAGEMTSVSRPRNPVPLLTDLRPPCCNGFPWLSPCDAQKFYSLLNQQMEVERLFCSHTGLGAKDPIVKIQPRCCLSGPAGKGIMEKTTVM